MKRSMTVLGICAAVCCTGSCAFAAIDTTAATTLKLNHSNTGGYLSALTNKNHWVANAGGTAVAPQLMDADISPNPDAAGYDYYVGDGKSLRTFKIDGTSPYKDKLITFGGRSLHIGPTGVLWPACTFEKFPLQIADLHFLESSTVKLSTSCGITNSAVTVESSSSNPMRIGDNAANATFWWSLFDCTLTGDASASILVDGMKGTGEAGFFYRGDGSGYLGTIRGNSLNKNVTVQLGKGTDLSHATIDLGATNAAASATLKMDSGATVSVGTLNLFDKSETSNDGSTSTFGTVNVYAGGSIVNKTSGRMNMGTLNQRGGEVTINSANRVNPLVHHLTGGRVVIGQKATVTISTVNPTDAEVSFRYNYNTDEHRYGCVNITNSFAGPVTLVLDSGCVSEFTLGGITPQTLVRIAKTAVATAPTAADFPVSVPDAYSWMLEIDDSLVHIEEDTDTWNVVLMPPYVYLTRTLSSSVKWDSSTTNVWSDGLPTHNDAHYLSRYQFYTYANAGSGNCRFDVKSLSIFNTELWLNTRNTTFPKLMVAAAALDSNNGAIVTSNPSNNVYATEIRVRTGTLANLRPYGGAVLNVYAPITGGGILQSLNRGTAKPSGVNTNFGGSELNLMQASPDFTGKIRTWKYSNGAYPYTVDESTKLGIAVPLALGGPLDAFRYDALELSYFSCLRPLASMTLDTANRGIFVNWYGRFLVESNLVFHVNERLTMGGTLEKIGAGTVWLGAPTAPQFTSAQLADPPSAAGADGTNLVRVLEGALGATTTNAVDGLALDFGSEGRLAVDPAVTDAVAAYGLYNAKGTVTFAGDALGVAISPPADDVAVATVGVLTVPTAQAAAFLDGTVPRLAAAVPKNYRADFSYEEDATAGLTTFKVTIARAGLTIIFR